MSVNCHIGVPYGIRTRVASVKEMRTSLSRTPRNSKIVENPYFLAIIEPQGFSGFTHGYYPNITPILPHSRKGNEYGQDCKGRAH
jgi:hypothetical protein